MTVCIATACMSGGYVVTATDGALSQGAESMDLALTKMYWFSTREALWQFLYAGEPGNADLILENMRHAANADRKALTREKIQQTMRRAYKKRFAEWTADYILAPYDMTMEEFKKEGRRIFGDELVSKLGREMSDSAELFREEVMLVGWGKSPRSVMIYGMNQSGAWSGSLTGLGTIGAGRDVAMSSLLLHGITRNSTLEDALYAVAAAKFSSERCDGVGENTTICVAKKAPLVAPKKGSEPLQPSNSYWFVEPDELAALRRLWELHGKIKIPQEGYETMMRISQRISGGVSAESAAHLLRGLSKRSASQTSEPAQ